MTASIIGRKRHFAADLRSKVGRPCRSTGGRSGIVRSGVVLVGEGPSKFRSMFGVPRAR